MIFLLKNISTGKLRLCDALRRLIIGTRRASLEGSVARVESGPKRFRLLSIFSLPLSRASVLRSNHRPAEYNRVGHDDTVASDYSASTTPSRRRCRAACAGIVASAGRFCGQSRQAHWSARRGVQCRHHPGHRVAAHPSSGVGQCRGSSRFRRCQLRRHLYACRWI